MYDTSFSLPRHPLGVKPAGNVYTSAQTSRVPLLQLPDELLVHILEYLDTVTLTKLGLTCKAFFAYSRLDDLWKTFCVESVPVPTIARYLEGTEDRHRDSPSPFRWLGNWHATYLGTPEADLARISVNNLASDALYRPFLCAHTPLRPYTARIPRANQIIRMPNLTASEFAEIWTDRPFILTQPVKEWPAWKRWSEDAFLQEYKDVVFRAEAVDWPLSTYVDYMNDNSDESPVYLFDHAFVEKMNLEADHDGMYWAPDCFGEDLFNVLGKQRPDHRWLIVGPERSGSTFHKDPNATSAWNAVVRGSKYWIMFPGGPQHPPPPGVFVSGDQSEVTSPLSIAEWLLGFHAEARETLGCIEGICEEGEILHVPSGWWHLVVNLSSSIALTQNFIPENHLVSALSFLKYKPDQVSGFRSNVTDPYGLFKAKLEQSHPELLEKALQKIEKPQLPKKRKWSELANSTRHQDSSSAIGKGEGAGESNGFSFGFGDDDHAEIP